MTAYPLLTQLLELQTIRRPAAYLLGCSGGCDSMTLLDLLVKNRQLLTAPVTVCYIHHGWTQQADDWQKLAETAAGEAGFAFTSRRLNLPDKTENTARAARYAVFAELLPAGGALLTAHHQNDQAETVLLQLLRGSGLDGLSAMPAVKPFARGEHWRPLLGCSRARIEEYARGRGLKYAQDPSNHDTRYARSWIRNAVLPLLESRYPAAAAKLAGSAGHLAGSRQWQERSLDDWLPDDITAGLSVQKLAAEPPDAQALLLRRWLQRLNAPPLPEKQLAQLQALLTAGHGEIHYQEHVILVHAGRVFALPETTPAPPPAFAPITHWQGIGTLTAHNLPAGNYRWALYPPSALFRPAGKPHHKPLKEWLRLAGVPPYLRRRMPLLYRENSLIWAGFIGLAAGEAPAVIQWQANGISDSIGVDFFGRNNS